MPRATVALVALLTALAGCTTPPPPSPAPSPATVIATAPQSHRLPPPASGSGLSAPDSGLNRTASTSPSAGTGARTHPATPTAFPPPRIAPSPAAFADLAHPPKASTSSTSNTPAFTPQPPRLGNLGDSSAAPAPRLSAVITAPLLSVTTPAPAAPAGQGIDFLAHLGPMPAPPPSLDPHSSTLNLSFPSSVSAPSTLGLGLILPPIAPAQLTTAYKVDAFTLDLPRWLAPSAPPPANAGDDEQRERLHDKLYDFLLGPPAPEQ